MQSRPPADLPGFLLRLFDRPAQFSASMGLCVSVEKIEEAHEYVLYAFGTPDVTIGRVRLRTTTGDIELVRFSQTDDGPDERYYFAQVVPRLQSYHDAGTYPEAEQWEV